MIFLTNSGGNGGGGGAIEAAAVVEVAAASRSHSGGDASRFKLDSTDAATLLFCPRLEYLLIHGEAFLRR